MSTINYRELRKRYEKDGAAQTVCHLSEAIKTGDLKPDDFSLRDLAEGLIPDGHLWVRELDPRSNHGTSLTESIEGVDVSAFSNITGKLISAKIMESYEQESFAVSKLVETIPTRLETERIPGVAPIVGDALEVPPGMPYPNLGFGEDYIDTPRTTKRGLIVSVTKEAIFFDRTHLVLRRAADVGEILGLNKEKRILDVVLGLKTNMYSWRGKSYNTYYRSSDTNPPWINLVANNELVDFHNAEKMEELFGNMVDPNTGTPVLVGANTVLVMPPKQHTAAQVFEASRVVFSNSGQTATSTFRNPYGRYQVVVSRLAQQMLVKSGLTAVQAPLVWYMGNFRKAFGYMENWPITVTQSPVQSDSDFSQDIVVRFKASERGAVAVLNPRFVVQASAT